MTIMIVRHPMVQARWSADHGIVRDAPLTDLGREQCQQLNEQSKDTIQKDAQLLVVSPVSIPTMLVKGDVPWLTGLS